MSTLICVKLSMDRHDDEKIIDYLTILIMQDTKFICNPSVRLRSAWMKAKRIYKEMSSDKKEKLHKLAKLNNYKDGKGYLNDSE